MVSISRHEWRWAAAFSALVMALTTLPYLLAAAAQKDGWRFSGFLWGVEDGNSYIAKMAQGARGAWLFRLTYSSEPQQGAFIYGLFLALGRIGGDSHTAQVLVYHAARVLFGFGLLLVSYRFISELLPRVSQRRLGLVLVALGGGLGWLLALLGHGDNWGSLPIDFYSPEAYSFLILYGLPHLALARSLMLAGVLAYWRRRGWLAGAALLGVSVIQPLYVLAAWALMGMDAALGWAGWAASGKRAPERAPVDATRAALAAGVVSSPIVLYVIYLFSSDPVFKQWNAQNVLTSPHPLHYVFGYGVLLVLAAPGWLALRRRRPEAARFVAGWAAILPLLLYAPLTTQRRLIEGFQLPLVACAVLGMTVALRSCRRWLIPAVLAVSLPTTAMLLMGGFLVARAPAPPVFHPPGQVAAFEWLARSAPPGQVVLSAFETGNVLPAYAPAIAYVGHGPETVFLAHKLPRVQAFYQAATSDAARRRLLADGGIAYVLFGPNERALGDFSPENVDYLRLRFADGGYAVYEVVP